MHEWVMLPMSLAGNWQRLRLFARHAQFGIVQSAVAHGSAGWRSLLTWILHVCLAVLCAPCPVLGRYHCRSGCMESL